MYTGLLHLHHTLAYIILILLLVNIFKNLANLHKPFTAADKKLGLFLMIAAHITLLIGLYQFIAGPYGWLHKPADTDIMKDGFWRFYLIEHPVGMIVAIALITIGKGVAKKDISDYNKHKRSAWLFSVALIIVLATIPWPFRELGIGRPLIP
ncbi:MAG: hypothetical protein QM610_13855 [Chitinophagaceae bacterium]